MRKCDVCGSRMAPFLPRTRLADGSLVCKGCANRDDTPEPRAAAKTSGKNPMLCPDGHEFYAEGYAATCPKCGKPASLDVEEVNGLGLYLQKRKTAADIPDHYRVLVLDRGEEVAIVVWSGHDPSEAMSKALEEQQDPDSINVYIERLRGAMGRYEVIWRNGETTEHFAVKTVADFRYNPPPIQNPVPVEECDHNEWTAVKSIGPGQYELYRCEGCGGRWRIYDTNTDEWGEPAWHPGAAQPPKTGSRKVAHDSGDGETIYHCPFCGAGQVVARSDGTAECGFCKTSFTVQVQPSMSAVPQTINGVPHVHPDMPGSEPGTAPVDESPQEDAETTDLTNQEQDDTNSIFAKRYYLTSEGSALDEDAYIRHLAIRHAEDRRAVIAAVRAERQDRG